MKKVAVAGCSLRPDRASNYVSDYLQKMGYKIFPVNPEYREILGEKCYANLLDIPEPVELVVIFRKSEHVLPIVEEAVKIGAKAVWMQDGVENFEAARIASNAGLRVIMNDCIMRVHQNLAMEIGLSNI